MTDSKTLSKYIGGAEGRGRGNERSGQWVPLHSTRESVFHNRDKSRK
jgi:hypothetical protein